MTLAAARHGQPLGQLLGLRAQVAAGRVTGLSVHPRQLLASALLTGLSPAEAEARITMLFAACPVAQTAALRAAVGAAGGLVHADTGVDDPRILDGERLFHHAWYFLIDLPVALDLPPEPAGLAPLRDAWQQLRQVAQAGGSDFAINAAQRHLFAIGTRITPGLPGLMAAAEAQLADLPAPALRPPVPAATARLARQALSKPSFCAAPDEGGMACETGALHRLAPAAAGPVPLIRRLIARAEEFQALLDGASLGGAVPAPLPPAGQAVRAGAARVETARGTLITAVELDAGGRLLSFAALAPTEWTFHSQGVLADLFTGRADHPRLDQELRAAAGLLDPCVAHRITVSRTTPAEALDHA